MTDVAEPMPITGDIAASSDVTVNTKGGSMTATLRKPLRDLLPDKMGHLSGAALEFEGGEAVVILAGSTKRYHSPTGVQVRRVSRNIFEIEMETEDGKSEEVDVVTAAFLTIKEKQLARGTLRLSDPMSAEGWRAKTDAELAEVRDMLASAARDGR